jgi:hypothetical protein
MKAIERRHRYWRDDHWRNPGEADDVDLRLGWARASGHLSRRFPQCLQDWGGLQGAEGGNELTRRLREEAEIGPPEAGIGIPAQHPSTGLRSTSSPHDAGPQALQDPS